MVKKLESVGFVSSGLLVGVLILFIDLTNFHQLADAACAFNDWQVGECVKFEDCPSAAALYRKGVSLGFCSIEDGTVCCPDYRSTKDPVKRPPSSNSEGWQSNAKDPYEGDPSGQRKKHSISNSARGDNKKKNNYNNYEEPYKFEIPYPESNANNKPGRRPAASNRPTYSEQSEDGFLPPGLAKKKPWREEKTTENDYYFEHITKKPNRGPPRKGPGKHGGNNYDSGRYETTTRRNDRRNGERRTTNNYDWFDSQNEYGNEQYERTTTKRNKWMQETYTTTKRNDYYGGGAGNNYGEDEDEFTNVKPVRRPQRPSSTSRPEGNRPGFQQGSRPQGSYRPGFEQGPRPQESRPGFQQGSRPQENNRPGFQQGSRPQDNYRPGLQQGSRPQDNYRPGLQQGSGFENNRPDSRPQKPRRISEQKCEEYSKQVIENITGLPLTTNPDPVTIPIRKCIQPQQLIVGGENTTLGEFPHMAAIGFRDQSKNQISWNCGGTLISDQYVMTAAHCTSTSSGRPVKVRLGEYNLRKNDDGAYPVDYGVAEIITHPEYRPPSKYHDIALLRLSRKVTFFKHIRPACLYVEESFSASKAIATGWGRLYYDGGTSEILQKVVLSIVDNNTCNRIYKINGKSEVLSRGIVGSQLCAGELTGGKDTCQGDSGGPLSITNTKCIHHVIGVTSFGKSCALPNSTGVYTRVSAYVPWIESIVWPTD